MHAHVALARVIAAKICGGFHNRRLNQPEGRVSEMRDPE